MRPKHALTQLRLESLEDRSVPSYLVTDLGTLGGNYSSAHDINASAQVVGSSLTARTTVRGFLWQNGVMTDLGTLGADYSEALGVNDVGQVVGRSMTGDGTYHGFLLTPEDTDGNGTPDRWFRDANADGKNDLMLDLGPNTAAEDVNNAGQVVGHSGNPYVSTRAVLWQNGVMTDLGTLGGSSSSATAVNDAGQVTGVSSSATGTRSAFLWQGGVMHDLGPANESNDINPSGQLAGAGAGPTATLWSPTTPNGTAGAYQSLGTLPPHGGLFVNDWFLGSYAVAAGVNESGVVVGRSTDRYMGGDPDGGYSYEIARAFVWADGAMQELPLNDATAVNLAGQIVGNSDGAPFEYRPNRAYLLTPQSDPTPFVHVDDMTITEGNGGTRTAEFTVRLSEASSQTVTVTFATANSSATAGSDYLATSGKVTFLPGEYFRTVSVPVVGDRLGEPNETFVVNLTGASNAVIADGQAVGTIVDDEPRISISDVTKQEGRKGQTTFFTFTLSLAVAYDQAVTLSFRTADGTAKTSNSDYVAKSGTITFAPGETTKAITITVKGDSKREGDESFSVDLFGNSTNSLFSRRRGIGWILNDD
ncbi:MAG: Calx-beta domain-containing protein [Isosphaeraceae bacterium]